MECADITLLCKVKFYNTEREAIRNAVNSLRLQEYWPHSDGGQAGDNQSG
jgi:hypothetical protein